MRILSATILPVSDSAASRKPGRARLLSGSQGKAIARPARRSRIYTRARTYNPGRSFEFVRLVRVLPARQEREEVRGGDRLDLLAETIEGVAVDAGQETPVAPRLTALESHAEDRAIALELEESGSSETTGPSAPRRPRSTDLGSFGASTACHLPASSPIQVSAS